MCGAVSGAVVALGYFFGRTTPTTPTDPKSTKTMELAFELQEAFRKNHKGVLCCHIHTKDMDMASGEYKAQCVAFTGEMAAKTAEIIARECNLKVEQEGYTFKHLMEALGIPSETYYGWEQKLRSG
jgi:C_GCAxxG_C_C family probable redox protein